MQIITPSGKRVWVRSIGEALRDFDGTIVKVQGAFQDITKRKISEEALRESETKLKRILNNLQDAYLQADLDGNITFANTTAAKIYGYANIQELLGLPTSNLYKDKKDREKLIAALSNSEKISDIVGEGLKKDGTTFWVSISVQYLKDNQGKIIGMEGLLRDISDRKQKEEQILKLSQAVDQSSACVILTNTKGNIEYANPKALKITGYTLEEIKGKNPRLFSSGEKSKSDYKNLWETILSGKEWNGEFHNRKKNGELYWELASISPIINENGEIINFLAIKEDITERKQILDDLIVAKEYAEKSEIRLLEAQKTTKVGSWETDLSNLNVLWSDETYRIFEISSTFFQATHQAFLNFVHPDDKKIVDDAFAKSFETKAYNSIEHRIITAKNTIKYVEERWKIVFNDQDNPTRAIGTCQDITERKQAEQELKEAKEKAEESDRLKSAFLANMSHEIRTPMNGILGFAGFLKEPGLSGEKQQKYIEISQKSGFRMLNIINDIVDISKIESGLMKIYITETDINEKIENLFQFFKPEVEAKNIQFSFKNTLPKNEAIIKTDSEKVYAVLSNLLKNAIKFTNEGEMEFGVGYESAATGKKQLKFFVKDTGMGIAKDRQQAIFERFIQADIYDKMALQGAGLGLSISKAYVEMLGGKIWVESEEGIGSAFYFTIPCNNETENIFVQVDEASINNDHESGKLKILIAEDDESSQILLTTIVEAYASEIFIANDGMEAVEIYKNHPDIDLILMDIQMPKLNGYEATSQIRQLNKNVVIIAQTAYALSYDRQKVMEAGCNDYISKPILLNDLKKLIRNYFA
ncbi:MAG TPA: PAS domain S-box protein, partial [Lutibacter sp.]|nr:PAS domain S-box protein [Lutibacter sp.]